MGVGNAPADPPGAITNEKSNRANTRSAVEPVVMHGPRLRRYLCFIFFLLQR